MQSQPEAASFPGPPDRVASGIAGLDVILGGGFFRGGIYVVGGNPGVGKTVLANQICFHHAGRGGRALYVTLLSETHGSMLSQMQTMQFFDRSLVGERLVYVSAFSQLESEGLSGLLTLVRRTARDHQATLLVLDGFVTAVTFARSEIDYKKFINELQTWVSLVGCTVLLLTSASPPFPDESAQPEHTMVDGILSLGTSRHGMRAMRELRVVKFRGSSYLEGSHRYLICQQGIIVHPRLESRRPRGAISGVGEEKLAIGVPGLDTLVGGGLASRSTTLVLGPPGAGKTILGMHFLDAGAMAGEVGIFFGFDEDPDGLLATSERLGMSFRRHMQKELLVLCWQPPGEHLIDEVGAELIERVRALKARRLFIDGLTAFRAAAIRPRRFGAYLSAVAHELRSLGVTTLIAERTFGAPSVQSLRSLRRLPAVFHNVLLLGKDERNERTRRFVSVVKTSGATDKLDRRGLEIGDRGMMVGEPSASRSSSTRRSSEGQHGRRRSKR